MGTANLLSYQHVQFYSLRRRPTLQPKMSEAFPGFTPQDFELYVTNLIGDYSEELQKMTFTDEKQTTYLMAIKYNANLIWESYNLNQNMFSVDQQVAMVNTDVLNTSLLSLHPLELLEEKDISGRSKKALADLSKFRDLILLKEYEKLDVQSWMEVAPNMNYSAQLCLMGWFLTLSSKMTDIKIPGVERMVVGGQIMKDRDEVIGHLTIMGNIAKEMYDKNYWARSQYSTLRKMYEDLNQIVDQF